MKSNREKRLIYGVLLAGGLGLLAVGWRVYHDEYQRLEEEWETNSIEYERTKTEFRVFPPEQIRARHKKIQDALRISGTRVDVELRIREELRQYLADADINENYDFRSEGDPEVNHEYGIRKFTYNVKDLTTTISKLTKFLNLLDQDSSLMEVEEMDINPVGRRGSDAGKHEVSLTLSRIVFDERIARDRKEDRRGRTSRVRG